MWVYRSANAFLTLLKIGCSRSPCHVDFVDAMCSCIRQVKFEIGRKLSARRMYGPHPPRRIGTCVSSMPLHRGFFYIYDTKAKRQSSALVSKNAQQNESSEYAA